MAAFTTQCKSWVAEKETIWPRTPEVLPPGPLQKKPADSHSETILSNRMFCIKGKVLHALSTYCSPMPHKATGKPRHGWLSEELNFIYAGRTQAVPGRLPELWRRIESLGRSKWALASFLPKKSQGWTPSEWTGWISLQSKRLSRVFSIFLINVLSNL